MFQKQEIDDFERKELWFLRKNLDFLRIYFLEGGNMVNVIWSPCCDIRLRRKIWFNVL